MNNLVNTLSTTIHKKYSTLEIYYTKSQHLTSEFSCNFAYLLNCTLALCKPVALDTDGKRNPLANAGK